MIILSIGVLASCTKGSFEHPTQTQSNQGNSKSYQTDIQYNSKNGLLIFKDKNSVRATLEMLEDSVNNRYTTFINNHSNLSENKLLALMDNIDFNEFNALTNFESNFPGYTSLRSAINVSMQNYYGKPTFDWANTPDNHFIQSEFYRTIVNEDNAFQVGDSTYIMAEKGWVSFPDQSDYNLVIQAIQDGVEPDILGLSIFGVECNSRAINLYSKKDGKELMVSTVKIISTPLGSFITAKTRAYRKWGTWWPKRCRISAGLYAGLDYYDGHCNYKGLHNSKYREKYGWKVVTRWNHYNQLVTVKYSEVHSSHAAFHNGIQADYYLLW